MLKRRQYLEDKTRNSKEPKAFLNYFKRKHRFAGEAGVRVLYAPSCLKNCYKLGIWPEELLPYKKQFEDLIEKTKGF